MFQAAKEGKAAKLFSHLRGFGQIYLTAQDAIPGKRRDRLLASRYKSSLLLLSPTSLLSQTRCGR